MSLRYQCLILDHDDTVAKSTPNIHYPSFVEALSVLRPNERILTYEEFLSYCFQPGFSSLCKEIINFTTAEQEEQQKIWKKYTQETIPDFYELFPETLQEFKRMGGIITVVSHSERRNIERDYLKHCGFIPDITFGWERAEFERKPHPFPVKTILSHFGLKEKDVLVLDDLKPGMMMAKSCNVDFAAAGWSHTIPEIKKAMKKEAKYYFDKVYDFKKFIM